MNNQLPSFFVVGAAKSGTTALWNYFQMHPEIYVTSDIRYKELGYYSRQYGINDFEKYQSYFKDAKDDQLVGEVCHAYLTSSESASWIKRDVPNAKIIIILRNPANRAYSLYNWMVMEGYEYASTFENALKLEPKRESGNIPMAHKFKQNYLYYSSGLYYEQVKRYILEFGKESVLVLCYEEFRNSQQHELSKVFEFLNVCSIEIPKIEEVNISVSVLSSRIHYYLFRNLRKYSQRKLLRNIFQVLIKLNSRKAPPKALSDRRKRDFLKLYEDDIRNLDELCNTDFAKLWLI